MAKNILSSNYTNQEVLHTKSAFLINKKFNLDIKSSSLDASTAIARAEAREQQFYMKFGQSTYDGFIKMVRSEFIDNENDRIALSNFSYSNLIDSLRELKAQTSHKIHRQEDYEVTITIKNNAPKEVEKILRPGKKGEKNSADGVTGEIVEGVGEIIKSIGVDDKKMVQLLNLARKQLTKKNKNGETENLRAGRKHAGAISSGSMGAKDIELMKKLEALMDKDASWLVIDLKKNEENTTLSTMFSEDRIERNFPWGYTPSQIKELIKDGEHLERLNKAFLVVKNYVLRTLGQPSSPQLSKAFHITWDRKIGPILNEDFSFFERGGINDALKGALGEFQTAALLELFNIKYGASSAKSIAQITGDTDSTAGLADVMAFENFGVQVKNFNEFGSTKDIKSTTNPLLLTQYFDSPTVARDVRIFLANYFFNDSFKASEEAAAQFTDLSADISQIYYALLSLSVNDEDKKVSFYTISGKYFVPVSEILRAIQTNQTTFGFNGINSKNTIHKTDDQFKNNNVYTKYWSPETTESGRLFYTPTEQNKTSYNNLVSNSITIKGSFDYKKILGDLSNSRYALY